jgi:hypothetical protein
MEKLILIMSIVCFIGSSFFLVAKVTKTNLFLTFVFRLIGILGVVLPILYWLKLNSVI